MMRIEGNARATAGAMSFILALGLTMARAQEVAVPAQSTAGALEEIVVTAEKRSQNMQEVPISIVAISPQQIENAGITNLQQLNTLVPSLNVSNIVGGVSFFIRGVGTTASQVENQVVTYVDDVYMPNQRTVGVDLIDVSQISVLKGPQGTLFGRNATGGVVQVSTRDPTSTPELEIQTRSDQYGTWRTSLFAGGPLNDNVKSSLMASYTTQDHGWGYNPIARYDTFRTGGDLNLRGKLLIDFSDRVSLKISVDHRQMEDTAAIIEVPYPGTVLAFEPNVVGPDKYYDSRGDYPNTQELNDSGISADLKADLGFATLRSITAYRRGTNDFQFDADRTPVPAFNIHVNENSDNASEEIQIISPENNRLKWVAGSYFFHNVNSSWPFTLHFQGPFAPGPNDLGLEEIYGSESAMSYAGFGQATLAVARDTNLTAGVRYTTETHRLVGTDTGTLNNGTVVPFTVADDSISFRNWSYRVTLDHKFSDDVMGFISNDRGFKAGGYNVSSLTNPPFKSEQLDAYQAGLKTELFDHHLRLNVTPFYYDYKNVQVVSFTFVSQVGNGAAAEMYGIDTDLEARINQHFWVTGGLSLLHSKFTDYPNAVYTVPLGAGAYQLISGNAAGNQTPFSQPLQATVGFNYTTDMRYGNLLFNLTDSYNAAFYYEADNNMRQPAFDYLNLSATWTSTSGRYSARLWGTNLLDQHVGTYAASQALGLMVSYGNPPLLYGITLGAKF